MFSASNRGVHRQDSRQSYSSQNIPGFVIPPTLQKRSSCVSGTSVVGLGADCNLPITIITPSGSMVRSNYSPGPAHEMAKSAPQSPKAASPNGKDTFFNKVPSQTSINSSNEQLSKKKLPGVATGKKQTARERRAYLLASNRRFLSTDVSENSWFNQRYGIYMSNSAEVLNNQQLDGSVKSNDNALLKGLRDQAANRNSKSLNNSVLSVLVPGAPQPKRTASYSTVRMRWWQMRRVMTAKSCCLACIRPCLKLYHMGCTPTSAVICAATCTILILLIGCLFMACLIYLNRDNIDLKLLKFW